MKEVSVFSIGNGMEWYFTTPNQELRPQVGFEAEMVRIPSSSTKGPASRGIAALMNSRADSRS